MAKKIGDKSCQSNFDKLSTDFGSFKLPKGSNTIKYCAQLSTALAWREKITEHFVFYKYFCLVFGLLKSRISKKYLEGLGRKLDFKLFHCKARVQPVSKITTIATRNRC
jgi:hypothetical protein